PMLGKPKETAPAFVELLAAEPTRAPRNQASMDSLCLPGRPQTDRIGECSPRPHASQPRLSRRRLCRCVRPVFAAPANLVNGVASTETEGFRPHSDWERA